MHQTVLYDSDTWSLRAEEFRRLRVFDHRFLRSIARNQWRDGVSNMRAKNQVLIASSRNTLTQRIKLSRLR